MNYRYGELVKMFYNDNENAFTNFDKITTKKDIDKLNAEILRYIEMLKNSKYISPVKSNSSKYLELIINLRKNKNLSSDEKMYILINVMDPNLKIFKEYKNSSIISFESISKCTNPNERLELLRSKKIEEDEFEKKIRSLIGFYSYELLKYEQIYYDKFVNEDNIKLEQMLYKDKNIDFNLTSEEKDKIDLLVINIKEKYTPNFKNIENIVLYNRESLGLNSNAESVYFLISLFDPGFKAATIKENFCNWKEIKKNIISELGFFSMEFVNLESNYAKNMNIEIDPYLYL